MQYKSLWIKASAKCININVNVSRHTLGCHKPQAGHLCFHPHEEESGECYTTHSDPAPCSHRPRAGSLCTTSLPHHGYVGDPIGAAGTVSLSLASAPQSVSVAPTDHQTRLCHSVRPASPQVQGHLVHFSQGRRCSCLACGNCSPAGEGCDRAGPSSRYGVGVFQPLLHCAQEKWWVTTDLGSGSATYNGHAVSGVWTGPQLRWHINCLELLAVRLALSRLRGRLQRKDILVRTDNTAILAYINQQGGLRSRHMSQLARHLLLWSLKHLRSLRAIHIPGVFNRAADELSRAALPGEWRLHPQAVQLIWGRFGDAKGGLVCISRNHPLPGVLLPNRSNARHGYTGTQLAPGPAQICVPPSEPTSTDTVQDQGGRGAGLVSGSILAQQDLVPGTHAHVLRI